MVKKKSVRASAKKNSKKKKTINKKNKLLKKAKKDFPSLKLRTESEIAMDFAVKVYKKFDKSIKSIVLFGSVEKHQEVPGSDIDIIIIIDDVSIKFDQEMIAWYREELDKILKNNPYKISLHINTVKLSTWWNDLLRGDPVLVNILRNGRTLIDMAGFFEPLKLLLIQGKIKSTPEAIYTTLQRAPFHLDNSISSQINSISGVYWAMVDSAQAALMAAKVFPASPEHIPRELKENFVDEKILNKRYVEWYQNLLELYKQIVHNKKNNLRGIEIDIWQKRANEFIKEMARIVDQIIKE